MLVLGNDLINVGDLNLAMGKKVLDAHVASMPGLGDLCPIGERLARSSWSALTVRKKGPRHHAPRMVE